jgi:hypothetical protein
VRQFSKELRVGSDMSLPPKKRQMPRRRVGVDDFAIDRRSFNDIERCIIDKPSDIGKAASELRFCVLSDESCGSRK